MYPFEYHRPGSLREAAQLHAQTDDAQWLAGGMTLLPAMKLRLAAPTALIDLAGIEGLRGVSVAGDHIEIGAMTIHDDVACATTVRQHIPALAKLANGIGDAQVRNRGTIGGSVANNDPAADYPAAVLGLGAAIVTTEREIAADAFFLDLFDTALEPGEIVTRFRFPIPERAAYLKFPNPASRYAIVGVMVAEFADTVRVAVTGAGASAFRVPEMEVALAQRFEPEAIDGLGVTAEGLNEDMHASAEYRAHLVTVMARRAVAAAA